MPDFLIKVSLQCCAEKILIFTNNNTCNSLKLLGLQHIEFCLDKYHVKEPGLPAQ